MNQDQSKQRPKTFKLRQRALKDSNTAPRRTQTARACWQLAHLGQQERLDLLLPWRISEELIGLTALTSPTRGFHKTCHAQAKLHPFGGAFVYDAAWLSLNPQKLSLSVFVRRYMRSRAQIFSGSAYVISASTWSSVTTTPSMTPWSTLGTRNCFHAVLRQSTASCSRTTVRWQRAVKLNVSEKAFRFSADAQGPMPSFRAC
jgi:hypothetical protein